MSEYQCVRASAPGYWNECTRVCVGNILPMLHVAVVINLNSYSAHFMCIIT